MTEKEEQVLKEIRDFYLKNKLMPTIRYLKEKLNYKSNYSIQLYLKNLEKQNYLTRNNKNKLIINTVTTDENLKIIKIINSNDTIALVLNKKKKYLGFKIRNDYFGKDFIHKGDIAIIECKRKLKNGELGLFIINQEYHIMKYYYNDGFYILKDKEEIILNKIKLVGKVIFIERKLS